MGSLGYCMSCFLLKPILPGAQKLGSRECEWRPIAHWNLIHTPCGSLVEREPSGSCGTDVFTCLSCGLVGELSTRTVRCDGEMRDIK